MKQGGKQNLPQSPFLHVWTVNPLIRSMADHWRYKKRTVDNSCMRPNQKVWCRFKVTLVESQRTHEWAWWPRSPLHLSEACREYLVLKFRSAGSSQMKS